MKKYNSVLYSKGGQVFERSEILHPFIDDSPFIKDKTYEFETETGIGESTLIFGGRGETGITLAESNLIKRTLAKAFAPFNEFLRWDKQRKINPKLARNQAMRKQRVFRKAFLERPSWIPKTEWAHGLRSLVALFFPESYHKFEGMKIQGLGNIDDLYENPVKLEQAICESQAEHYDNYYDTIKGLPIFEDDDQGLGSLEHEYNKAMFTLYKAGGFGDKTPEEIDLTEEKTFLGLDLGYSWISKKKSPPRGWVRRLKTNSKSYARKLAKTYEKKRYKVIIQGRRKGSRRKRENYKVFTEPRAPKIKVKKPKQGFNMGNAYKAMTKRVAGGAKYVGEKTYKGAKWVGEKIKEGVAWVVKKIKEIADFMTKLINAKKKEAKARKDTAKSKQKALSAIKTTNAKFKKANTQIQKSKKGGIRLARFENPILHSIMDISSPARKIKRTVRKCRRGKLRKYKGRWVCQVTTGKKLRKAYIQKVQAKYKSFKKTIAKYNKHTKDFNKKLGESNKKRKEADRGMRSANKEKNRLQGLKRSKSRSKRGIDLESLRDYVDNKLEDMGEIQLGFVCGGLCIAAIIAGIMLLIKYFDSMKGSSGYEGDWKEATDDGDGIDPMGGDWEPSEEFDEPGTEYEYYPEEEPVEEEEEPRYEPAAPSITPRPELAPPPAITPRARPPEEEEEEEIEPEYEEEEEYYEPEEGYEEFEPEYDEDYEDEEDEYEEVDEY